MRSAATLGNLDDGMRALHFRPDLTASTTRTSPHEASASLASQAPPFVLDGRNRIVRGPQVRALGLPAARILRGANGPNVAAVEFSGWDTHANQGGSYGQLGGKLLDFGRALASFSGASSTLASEMKLASHTRMSTGSGTMLSSRLRALVCS